MKENWKLLVLLALFCALVVPAVVLFGGSTWFWMVAGLFGLILVPILIFVSGLEEQPLRGETRIAALIAMQSKLQPAPQGVTSATEGNKPMIIFRAFGYIWTPLAAAAWYLTVAVYALVFLWPGAKTQPMPVVGGTVFQFFLDFAPVGFGVLLIANGLSSRWGPESMRRMDLWATRVGFYGMVIIGTVVGFVLGIEDLPRNAIIWLLVTLAFAIYDLLVNQGEDWRSSVLRGQVAAIPPSAPTRAPAGTATATASETGPFMSFVSELGPCRIHLNGNFELVLDQDGFVDADTSFTQSQIVRILNEEVGRRSALPTPVDVAPAPAP